MSTRHERLSELFLRVRDLSAVDRALAMATAFRESPSIAAEVESMLRHEDDLPELLEIEEADAALPESIGPYTVLGKLGAGGMGEIFLGEQGEPLPRRVAVKVARSAGWQPSMRHRFETERHALARLQHPNVARVFEAGTTDDGRPYLAMELVNGPSITRYCDAQHLSIGARLELFLQVCEGVQHAHGNAILHRDLKPGNVLIDEVDGRPLPKIIDFGVAKALDEVPPQGGRQAGRRRVLLGTPAYMSPEQALGVQPVDTRTDVYALGGILFELLCGLPPVRFDGIDELDVAAIRRRIADRPDRTPSRALPAGGPVLASIAGARSTRPARLRRALAGDLDQIVCRAMARDPANRYESASQLAEEIRRHLRHEPILAAPPARLYRVRKALRRNRATATFAAVVAMVLLGTSIVSMLAAGRAHAARVEAERLAQYLMELQSLAGPADFRPMEADVKLLEQLDRGKRLASGLSLHPVLLARLQHSLGEAYLRIGDEEEARSLFDRAEAGLTSTVGPDHLFSLDLRSSRAMLERAAGGGARAETILEEVVASATALGLPGRQTAEDAMGDLTRLRLARGDRAGARKTIVALVEKLAEDRGADDPETLKAAAYLAVVDLQSGNYVQARKALVDLVPRLSRVLGPRHDETLIALYNLAASSARLGDEARALADLREAVDRGLAIGHDVEVDPDFQSLWTNPEFIALAYAHKLNFTLKTGRLLDLGELHFTLGQIEKGSMIYRDAHEAGKRIYEPDQYALLYLLERDAMGRSFLGEVAEAEELLREALRGAEGLRPADRGLFLQSVHWDLARCRLAVGDRDGALAFLQTPRPVERSSDGTCGACEWDGAVIASLRGNREEALRHLRAVLTRWPLAMYAPEHDPLFQDLHGDPRFHELLASVRHPYMRVLF